MVQGPMVCVKYLLCVFNLLFLISGLIVLLIGVIVDANYTKYKDFLDTDYSNPPVILFWTGILILLIGFCGCFGSCRENRFLINTFAVLLGIIFLLELGAGIAGYLFKNDVDAMLKTKFNESIAHYSNNTEVQTSWDILQKDFDCCGAQAPSDWKQVFPNGTLPNTCCGTMPKNSTQPCSVDCPTVSTQGCLPHLRELVIGNAQFLGSVGVSIALLQVLGIVCGCALARKIGQEYETV